MIYQDQRVKVSRLSRSLCLNYEPIYILSNWTVWRRWKNCTVFSSFSKSKSDSENCSSALYVTWKENFGEKIVVEYFNYFQDSFLWNSSRLHFPYCIFQEGLGNCTVEERKFSFLDKTFLFDEAQWTLSWTLIVGGANCTEEKNSGSVYSFPLIRSSLMIL